MYGMGLNLCKKKKKKKKNPLSEDLLCCVRPLPTLDAAAERRKQKATLLSCPQNAIFARPSKAAGRGGWSVSSRRNTDGRTALHVRVVEGEL